MRWPSFISKGALKRGWGRIVIVSGQSTSKGVFLQNELIFSQLAFNLAALQFFLHFLHLKKK
ncbi:MAG: hypothetical protein FJ333_00590 [Sphingomonadales bacterium]|nr:hypothetical protein [Sphingomonadales bacterium]